MEKCRAEYIRTAAFVNAWRMDVQELRAHFMNNWQDNHTERGEKHYVVCKLQVRG
jgi:hypothetical protein